MPMLLIARFRTSMFFVVGMATTSTRLAAHRRRWPALAFGSSCRTWAVERPVMRRDRSRRGRPLQEACPARMRHGATTPSRRSARRAALPGSWGAIRALGSTREEAGPRNLAEFHADNDVSVRWDTQVARGQDRRRRSAQPTHLTCCGRVCSQSTDFALSQAAEGQ